MDKRIELLEQNFVILNNELTAIKELLSAGFTKIDNNFTNVKREIDLLKHELTQFHKKVDELKSDTSDGLGDVGVKIENLTEEITKINIVTSYGDQFENMKGLS